MCIFEFWIVGVFEHLKALHRARCFHQRSCLRCDAGGWVGESWCKNQPLVKPCVSDTTLRWWKLTRSECSDPKLQCRWALLQRRLLVQDPLSRSHKRFPANGCHFACHFSCELFFAERFQVGMGTWLWSLVWEFCSMCEGLKKRSTGPLGDWLGIQGKNKRNFSWFFSAFCGQFRPYFPLFETHS